VSVSAHPVPEGTAHRVHPAIQQDVVTALGLGAIDQGDRRHRHDRRRADPAVDRHHHQQLPDLRADDLVYPFYLA
jgi:hypothetical protein